MDQAKELAAHLAQVEPPVERVFSSPYYRCLQTVQPFIEMQQGRLAILGETGLSEWYGAAPFEHPTSAPPETLNRLFPAYDTAYEPAVAPERTGETIAELHERVARALDAIVRRCDAMGVRAVLLCSHAATIIAMGRTLTGQMPDNVEAEDFRVFTCGLSVFRRRGTEQGQGLDWKEGRGVGGGWNCEVNSDCSFLSGGEERGW